MEKAINYLARDFNSIKSELISFSKKYYPEMTESFNDSSVGAWFIDLVSAVGDDLSYSIDRVYQENNLNSIHSRKSALNIARLNGVKVPGPKASMCEVQFTCTLPVNAENISSPNWAEAPTIKRDTIVGNGTYNFELMEDVDFASQFNNNGFSNRKFEPLRNGNGLITAYTVSKSVMAIGGTSKVYKKVITQNELKPFMEVILPDKNIMSVESILFKAADSLKTTPNMSEYYIDEEEFRMTNEYINTYRYFEVDSLSDLYRFGTETIGTNSIDPISGQTELYVDYTETITANGDELTDETPMSVRTSRIYKGRWKPLTQKFITEYTDNGYMKIIFGAGSYDTVPSGSTYAEFIMSNSINNNMLGVLPDAGWTMYILYRVGGGSETNMAANSITNIAFLDTKFKTATDNKNKILNSIKVTNLSTSLAGKNEPSTQEIVNLIKYNVASQNRCVTINDYKARLMQMPPRYGCPFRCNVIEENNKIVIPMLGVTANGKLDDSLPSLLVDNIKEYFKNYKNIGDYIELKSGKIYNLGFEIDVFIDKNYTTEFVIKTIIEKIKEYMDINAHDMGDSLFIGDLEKELNKLDGVIALIDFRVYNIYGNVYGSNAKFPVYKVSESCSSSSSERFLKPLNNAPCYRIDLEALDSLLENDYNSMFEILNEETDIAIRVKLK